MLSYSVLLFAVLKIGFVVTQSNLQNPYGQQQGNPPTYGSDGYMNNDGSNIYSRVQMLRQPFNAPASNNSVNPATNPTAVNVEVKLKDYVDQGLRLPGGMTCVCPSGFSCPYLGTTDPRCFMSFTIIVSSPGGSVQYMTTEFLPLTDSGHLDLTRVTQEQANQWHQAHIFHLKAKPSAIDIFVHHMGVVINSQSGELAQMQSVVHVDTFVQSLVEVLPDSTQMAPKDHSVTLTGQLLQTQLSLSYSIKCAGGALGPNCDLQCNKSSVNSDVAVCHSVDTGFFYVCSYTSDSQQVENCNPCPWGIAEDSYCRDKDGGVLNPSSAQVVPPGFKTATIVLAVIAGTLFILLMVMTIYSCVLVKRTMKYEQEAPGHNYRSSLRAEGNANRPLLQTTYTAQSPAPSDISSTMHNAPVAAPRSIPNIDAIPAKSSLRKTNYIPPAHLGGNASVNDTLNSSFASVPMPPSREADV